jgi:uncharacterized protein YndB with AHSA1/START domain
MSTTLTTPYRLQFSVEVPGTPEQVWDAIATAKGMSAWFGPTELEEREGGALRFVMGPDMDSTGEVTAWEPPRRLVYQEDWAALMGQEPDALSPLTSEFVVEARSGGTCVVRVTSSGFGTGAAWEQEFWDDLEPQWKPFFDNLRVYLERFTGQESTHLEASAALTGDGAAVWQRVLDAVPGLGELGADVEVRGARGTVERVGHLEGLVRLTEPVPGMLNLYAFAMGEATTAGVRGFLFSPDAAEYVRREQGAWRGWLAGL